MYQEGLGTLYEQIKSGIEEGIRQIHFSVEAASNFPYEEEVSSIYLKDYHLRPIGAKGEVVVPVRYDETTVVAAAEIVTCLEVEINSSFSYRDPVDKDYIPFGSNAVSVETEVVLECLLTFEGDFEDDPGNVELTSVEIQPTREHLEMWEVEPDWMGQASDHVD